jgi:photosystem II stability/assembly factor-like uncharacterized protein
MKKIIISIILILSVFFTACNTKVNNLEELLNSSDKLSKIIIYNDGNSITVDNNSSMYESIINHTHDMFKNNSKLELTKKEFMYEESKNTGLALEFMFNENVKASFSVGDNEKSMEFSRMFILFEDNGEVFLGDKDKYFTKGIGLFKNVDELKKLIKVAGENKEDNLKDNLTIKINSKYKYLYSSRDNYKGYSFINLNMIDVNNGWATAKGKHSNIVILKTEDGGINWDDVTPRDIKIQDELVYSKAYLLCGEYYFDENRAYFIAENFNEYNHGLYIFSTDDSGFSWKRNELDIEDKFDTGHKEFLFYFINEKEGYILLTKRVKKGVIKVVYRTVDGGKSFTKVSDVSMRNGEEDTLKYAEPTGMWFKDVGRGFITTLDNNQKTIGLYKTEDEGKTWTNVNLCEYSEKPYLNRNRKEINTYAPTAGYYSSVCLTEYKQGNGSMFQTYYNGGIGSYPWSGNTIEMQGDINNKDCIYFKDFMNGWVLCKDILYRTKDMGRTWEKISSCALLKGRYFTKIYFVDETGFAIVDGSLMKSYDSGKTWRYIDDTFKENEIIEQRTQNIIPDIQKYDGVKHKEFMIDGKMKKTTFYQFPDTKYGIYIPNEFNIDQWGNIKINESNKFSISDLYTDINPELLNPKKVIEHDMEFYSHYHSDDLYTDRDMLKYKEYLISTNENGGITHKHKFLLKQHNKDGIMLSLSIHNTKQDEIFPLFMDCIKNIRYIDNYKPCIKSACMYGLDEIGVKGLYSDNYEGIIKTLGKPNEIKNLEDDGLIANKGYFSILKYDGLGLVMYCDFYAEDPFKLEGSDLVHIIINGDNFQTKRGITVGDSVDKAMKVYGITKITDISGRDSINGWFANSFLDEEEYVEYDKCLVVMRMYEPTRMVLLIKDNKVDRIVIGNPNAG